MASKLSPALRALMPLRGSPAGSPAPAVLSKLYDQFRVESKQNKIGESAWQTLASASLVTLNSPKALEHLAGYVDTAGSPSKEDRVARALLLREAGLKCISFIGIAKVINQLGALANGTDPEIRAALPKQPSRQPTPEVVNPVIERGHGLWSNVYAPFDKKLIDKLADYHPDLPVHILTSHYGPLLSDPAPGQSPAPHPIGRVLTSLVAVACLRAVGGVGPQVTSHVFGLKKAADVADGTTEGLGENWKWLTQDEGAAWALQTVDRVVEAIESAPVEQPKAKL